MAERVFILAGLAAAAMALTAALALRGEPSAQPTPPVAARPAAPALYCEFYNFVGRSPKVGFTFAMTGAAPSLAFAQVNQLEMDGTRAEFGPGPARPLWAFDGSDSPATLTSPDRAITINLYAYDPKGSGSGWIEAGLRSIQYLNLDGKCRRSAV